MTELPDDLAAGPGQRDDDAARAEVAAHLAATRLFANLAPDALMRLAAAFDVVHLTPGAMVARQGTVDPALHVVTEGQLAIDRRDEDGRVEVLGYAGYGAVVGIRGVFTDAPRTTGVMVLEPVTLLRIARDDLWQALAADLDAARRLVLPEAARRRVQARQADGVIAGEYEVARYRRHWTALLRHMILPGALLGASMVLAGIFALALPSPTTVAALALLALAVPVVVAVWAFFDYYNDQLIVTNRRIVHIESTPLVDTERVEAPLARVQDIQVTVPSVVARVLGYGTIIVQTAGSRSGIVFDALPHPEDVRHAIVEIAQAARAVADRDHDRWIEHRVREALGWAPPAGGPPLPGTAERAGGRHASGGMFGGAARYFWPRVRVQEGDAVTWRKHWWLLFKPTLVPAGVWALIGAWVALRGWRALAGPPSEVPPFVGTVWLVAVWLLLLAVLLYLYEDWRNDFYVLTDEHIIDVDAKPLGLFANRRQAGLGQIQDIRYRVPNILATVLGFGDVMIETAAEHGSFTFEGVHHPATVQQEIFARIDAYRARQEAAAQASQAEELTRWIAAYHQITGDAPPPPPGSSAPRPGSRTDDAPLPGAYPDDGVPPAGPPGRPR